MRYSFLPKLIKGALATTPVWTHERDERSARKRTYGDASIRAYMHAMHVLRLLPPSFSLKPKAGRLCACVGYTHTASRGPKNLGISSPDTAAFPAGAFVLPQRSRSTSSRFVPSSIGLCQVSTASSSNRPEVWRSFSSRSLHR